jgi:hypothetical protein
MSSTPFIQRIAGASRRKTATGPAADVLLLLALVSLLPREASGDEVEATTEQTFELRVVGPDGKHVPEASVELRTNPIPTAEQISLGKFVRTGTYGAFATTDGQGRLLMKLPRTQRDLDVSIATPGYGPYWASWSADNSEVMPATFTAELEAGWSVGGNRRG